MMRCSVAVKSRPSTRVWKRPVAAEQVVDHEEHQIRVEHEQRGTAQRLHVDQVQIGRNRQIAGEFAVLHHLHRADGNFRGTAHEVEEADAQQTREAVVDDFEAGHPAADDAFLRGDVVRPDTGAI
jgi:hypothetical protein